MTLYEADLDKIAVEVKSVSKRKAEPKQKKETVKKPRVRKQKVEEPKVEEPKIEEPKVEESKVEASKVEEPKVEEPKVEETKVEETKVEEQKVEEPKVEAKIEKKRAPRKKRDPSIPPTWFAKYVEGVKKEQAMQSNAKVPAKKVKEDAQETATKSWSNGLTRNRVENEVNSHSKVFINSSD